MISKSLSPQLQWTSNFSKTTSTPKLWELVAECIQLQSTTRITPISKKEIRNKWWTKYKKLSMKKFLLTKITWKADSKDIFFASARELIKSMNLSPFFQENSMIESSLFCLFMEKYHLLNKKKYLSRLENINSYLLQELLKLLSPLMEWGLSLTPVKIFRWSMIKNIKYPPWNLWILVSHQPSRELEGQAEQRQEIVLGFTHKRISSKEGSARLQKWKIHH